MSKKNEAIKAIMRAENCSRSTAYARYAERSAAGAEQPAADAQEPSPLAADVAEGSLIWANAILWAAKYVNTPRMTLEKAGSLLNFSLWQSGQENPKTLVFQLVPKAMAILGKNEPQAELYGMPPGGVEEEKQSIAELRKMLAGAVDDCEAGGWTRSEDDYPLTQATSG